MPRLPVTPIIAGAIVLLIPFVASACAPVLDPVTTYTNGMPLASSDPERSHNAYYKCDPDRTGCCGGRYNFACLNSLLWPDSCDMKHRTSCYGRWSEPVGGGMEEVEPVRFEQLGALPDAPLLGAGRGARDR